MARHNWKAFSQHVSVATKMAEDNSENPSGHPPTPRPQRLRTRTEKGDLYAQELLTEEAGKRKRKPARPIAPVADPSPSPPPATNLLPHSFTDEEQAEFDADPHANSDPEPEEDESGDGVDYHAIRATGAFSSVSSTPAVHTYKAKTNHTKQCCQVPQLPLDSDDTSPPQNQHRTSLSTQAPPSVAQHVARAIGLARPPLQDRTLNRHDIQTPEGTRTPQFNKTTSATFLTSTAKRPAPATKLNHDSDPDDADDEEESNQPSKKRKRDRPVQRNLTGIERTLSDLAIADYKAVMAMQDPWPSVASAEKMANDALVRSCVAKEYTIEDSQIYELILDLLVERASEGRGKLCDKLVPMVQSHYRFDNRGTVKGKKANRALTKQLLTDNALIYKDPSGRTGMYEHPILQDAINSFWFSGDDRAGLVFPSYFDPIPLVTIALILTTVQFAIKQWSTGIRETSEHFKAKIYQPVYERHLQALEDLRDSSPAAATALRTLQERMRARANRAAGVTKEARKHKPILQQADFTTFLSEQQTAALSDEDNSDEGVENGMDDEGDIEV